MKNKILNLFTLFCFLAAFTTRAADLNFDINNVIGQSVTNRKVLLTPLFGAKNKNGKLIVQDKVSFTPGNLPYVLPNLVEGKYQADIAAPPTPIRFFFLVPDTNAAVNVSEILVDVPGEESAFYTASASDARYLRIDSSGALISPSNFFRANSNALNAVISGQAAVDTSGFVASSYGKSTNQLLTSPDFVGPVRVLVPDSIEGESRLAFYNYDGIDATLEPFPLITTNEIALLAGATEPIKNLARRTNETFSGTTTFDSTGATIASTTNDFVFSTGGFSRWRMLKTGGDLVPNVNDTYSLGSPSARIKNITTKNVTAESVTTLGANFADGAATIQPDGTIESDSDLITKWYLEDRLSSITGGGSDASFVSSLNGVVTNLTVVGGATVSGDITAYYLFSEGVVADGVSAYGVVCQEVESERSSVNTDSYVGGDMFVGGKITTDGGIDPDYLEFNKLPRAQLKAQILADIAGKPFKTNDAFDCWPAESKRREYYVPADDTFYFMDGSVSAKKGTVSADKAGYEARRAAITQSAKSRRESLQASRTNKLNAVTGITNRTPAVKGAVIKP